ncbi:MAG: HupE/UreJ family protein [Cyanobacteria bacterium]|nr:HupE/UreJ family protein [Cyanobacteriota bacterium]
MAPWITVGIGLLAAPALAHHPFGGQTPANAWEGFLSGLGHPVIGFDHLVFVLAIGLLAATKTKGWLLPVTFVAATLFGTGIHLWGWNLPAPEVIIAASVWTLGLILAMGSALNLATLAGLGLLAGLFHGYAYGEAIIGAEMTPLVAYLLGFGAIQLAIASGVYGLVARCFQGEISEGATSPRLPLRFAGFTILGIGVTLLSGFVVG